MAFGIPGSEDTTSNGPFLSRIQYDARVGFWTIVKRVQNSDGSWSNETGEPFQKPTFLVDFGTLEVGYLKLTSPPAFVLVPMGSTIPTQPQEMMTDSQGKQRKAFLPGFRVQVCGKIFGDKNAYHFNSNAKTVIAPVEELWKTFSASPEAATGKIPAVANTKTRIVEIVNPKGTSKFHAPVFEIVGWAERPAVFGERTVPIPTSKGATEATKPPSNHVPPPPAPAPVPATAGAEMPMDWE